MIMIFDFIAHELIVVIAWTRVPLEWALYMQTLINAMGTTAKVTNFVEFYANFQLINNLNGQYLKMTVMKFNRYQEDKCIK